MLSCPCLALVPAEAAAARGEVPALAAADDEGADSVGADSVGADSVGADSAGAVVEGMVVAAMAA